MTTNPTPPATRTITAITKSLRAGQTVYSKRKQYTIQGPIEPWGNHQSRIMQQVWIPKLNRFDLHPELIVTDSIRESGMADLLAADDVEDTLDDAYAENHRRDMAEYQALAVRAAHARALIVNADLDLRIAARGHWASLNAGELSLAADALDQLLIGYDW